MKHFHIGIVISVSVLLSACAPGPMGAKRYQPYSSTDAAVIYTQVNEKHQGLVYLQRYTKESDCYEKAETIYISNNLLDGASKRLLESRIKPNEYWSIYVIDNSQSMRRYSSVAFIPEAGKRYVGVDARGVVEIPQDLPVSQNDDLDKIYDMYKDHLAKHWNVREGVCKFWFAKVMGA